MPAVTAFHLKTYTFIVIAQLSARRCRVNVLAQNYIQATGEFSINYRFK